MGKSAQKNPPGKSPGKSSKIYTTKVLQHISADWPGQQLVRFLVFLSFLSDRSVFSAENTAIARKIKTKPEILTD